MRRLGAEERAAVARSLVDPSDAALTAATRAVAAWLSQAFTYYLDFRKTGQRPAQASSPTYVRAFDTGAMTLAAIFLRNGDARGALDALDQTGAQRAILPAFYNRIRAAVRRRTPPPTGRRLAAMGFASRDPEEGDGGLAKTRPGSARRGPLGHLARGLPARPRELRRRDARRAIARALRHARGRAARAQRRPRPERDPRERQRRARALARRDRRQRRDGRSRRGEAHLPRRGRRDGGGRAARAEGPRRAHERARPLRDGGHRDPRRQPPGGAAAARPGRRRRALGLPPSRRSPRWSVRRATTPRRSPTWSARLTAPDAKSAPVDVAEARVLAYEAPPQSGGQEGPREGGALDAALSATLAARGAAVGSAAQRARGGAAARPGARGLRRHERRVRGRSIGPWRWPDRTGRPWAAAMLDAIGQPRSCGTISSRRARR